MWTEIQSSHSYYYWVRIEDGKPIYNCTTTKHPPQGSGGYFSLKALMALKNEPYEVIRRVPNE